MTAEASAIREAHADLTAPRGTVSPPADTARLLDRALGAYLGLAIGDALGATVEFMTPREIAHRHGVHRELVGGGWLKLPPGEVTDDTTMSLALGDALLQGGPEGLRGRPADLRRIAEAWVAWLRARPVDCGNTCRRGLQRFIADGTLQGPPQEGDAGNGALMRNLPVLLATLFDDAAFEHLSIAQARITHHHPLSDAAVLGLGRLTRAALRGAAQSDLALRAQAFSAEHPAFRFTPYPRRASAYVVDTVQTVLHHTLHHTPHHTLHAGAAGTPPPGFEAVLIATVNQGEDADTTGALAGMLAGAQCGASALPARWLQRLKPAVRRAVTEQAAALLALALQAAAPAAAASGSTPTRLAPA